MLFFSFCCGLVGQSLCAAALPGLVPPSLATRWPRPGRPHGLSAAMAGGCRSHHCRRVFWMAGTPHAPASRRKQNVVDVKQERCVRRMVGGGWVAGWAVRLDSQLPCPPAARRQQYFRGGSRATKHALCPHSRAALMHTARGTLAIVHARGRRHFARRWLARVTPRVGMCAARSLGRRHAELV